MTDHILTEPRKFTMVIDGRQFKIINDTKLTMQEKAQVLGGWATDTPINSITDVRNKLAVPEEWKSGRLYTVEFVAKPGTNVREGTVGDMWSNSSKERLPGGGHQVEFKTAPRDNSPLFEIISVPKEIK